MSQVTTITFLRYQGLRGKLWAFGMMQFAHNHLKKTKGLLFYKLLGTGKGLGFNPWPDFSVYALLQVWDNEEYAESFLNCSKLIQKYEKRSIERWTLFMQAIKAEGKWSGQNPFATDASLLAEGKPIAVITRASIRKNCLRTFWKYVPTSEKPLYRSNALIYTKGIGEVPFLQMATFSLWKDPESLKAFAYQSKEHQQAIKMTRELDWYSEELFSRFRPYRSDGTWNDNQVLID